MGTSPTDPAPAEDITDAELADRIASMDADDRDALFAAMDELRFQNLPQSNAEARAHQPAVAATRLPAPVERTPATTMNGAPLVPPGEELGMLGQMAVTLCAAQTVPAALRNRPNDVFLILLAARDLGVDLSSAIREFHVVEGKVTLSPKIKLAMVRRQGLGRVWPDPGNDDREATWYAVRYDCGEDQVFGFTFTMEDAQRAGLIKDKSAWKTYPQRMLSWRALGYLIDDVFSEVGAGLYSPDELGSVTDPDGNPVLDVTEVDPVRGTNPPQRQRNRAADRQRQAEQDQQVISTEDHDRIQATIDKLRDLPEAKDALVALWTGGDDDARRACNDCTREAGCDRHRRLYPLDRLPAADVGIAEARVTEVVTRVAGGEFLPPGGPVPGWVADYLAVHAPTTAATEPAAGDPGPTGGANPGDGDAPPQEAQSAEVAQSEGDGAEAAAEQLAEAAAEKAEADHPAEPQPDKATIDALIEHLRAMTKEALIAELGHRGMPGNAGENKDTLCERLGTRMLAEGWTPGGG